MREVHVNAIAEAVCDLYKEICYIAGADVRCALEKAQQAETGELAKQVLSDLLLNIDCARSDGIPLCQDTGMAVVFLTLGQDVHLIGGDVHKAVDDGVRCACEEGYLRASVLSPLERVKTKDNAPAILHIDIMPGDKVRIEVAAKGFGSENMSRMGLITPAGGKQAVEDFIVESVRLAGGNPCPPVIVGVGIGGTIEKAAYMAKHALLRPLDTDNADIELDEMEKRLLARINTLGIGPQGLGGDTTALKVLIESFPTHIAGLPVVVNMQCHSARHKAREIG